MKHCPHCEKPLNLKTCAECGKRFAAKRCDAKLCSAACKARAFRKREKDRKEVKDAV